MIRDNSYYAIVNGVELRVKDIVITGKEASLQLDMVDGSILRLGADSRIVLSEYKVDSKKQIVGALINVLSGWLRFAVAKLQNNASYNFNTPVMMVGVRGTEGIVEAKSNDNSGLYLQEGLVQVQHSQGSEDKLKGVSVGAGQYITRQRGNPFKHAFRPPNSFKRRIPGYFRPRMARLAHRLKVAHVRPRLLRRMRAEDAQRFMRRHPHMQHRFQKRFKKFNLPMSRPGVRRGVPIMRKGTVGRQPGVLPRNRQLKPRLQHNKKPIHRPLRPGGRQPMGKRPPQTKFRHPMLRPQHTNGQGTKPMMSKPMMPKVRIPEHLVNKPIVGKNTGTARRPPPGRGGKAVVQPKSGKAVRSRSRQGSQRRSTRHRRSTRRGTRRR